ncbi:hypothetical protein [Algibacter pacificus]|uniref:hypothetical protein n=1 Tax=Algibacter pacificus TaxID=2599389 RepID=UPI0011C6FB5F|nr:hypothetical protein [Algibacter pacificus]
MKEIDIVNICESVLSSLATMGYESNKVESVGQLIFPVKNGGQDRISEQELRQLFIEEFKDKHEDLCYSIETPTIGKFKFGEKFEDISSGKGRSASLDMCIYKRDKNTIIRDLNIEFKFNNVSLYKIGKDILKLMKEEQNGVFILLLNNTDRGTLCNIGHTGVLDKLSQSFNRFKDNWQGNKSIQLVIISLQEKVFIHRTITDTLFENEKTVFSICENSYVNMSEINEDSGWEIVRVK